MATANAQDSSRRWFHKGGLPGNLGLAIVVIGGVVTGASIVSIFASFHGLSSESIFVSSFTLFAAFALLFALINLTGQVVHARRPSTIIHSVGILGLEWSAMRAKLSLARPQCGSKLGIFVLHSETYDSSMQNRHLEVTRAGLATELSANIVLGTLAIKFLAAQAVTGSIAFAMIGFALAATASHYFENELALPNYRATSSDLVPRYLEDWAATRIRAAELNGREALASDREWTKLRERTDLLTEENSLFVVYYCFSAMLHSDSYALSSLYARCVDVDSFPNIVLTFGYLGRLILGMPTESDLDIPSNLGDELRGFISALVVFRAGRIEEASQLARENIALRNANCTSDDNEIEILKAIVSGKALPKPDWPPLPD